MVPAAIILDISGAVPELSGEQRLAFAWKDHGVFTLLFILDCCCLPFGTIAIFLTLQKRRRSKCHLLVDIFAVGRFCTEIA